METSNENAAENDEAATGKTFRFIENHYFSLPSQGNVYTLVPLKSSSGSARILIASLQKKVFCIECCEGKYAVHDNLFSCIPSGADIVSMAAYQKNNKYDVGLTMILNDGPSDEGLLNLYSDWDVDRGPFNQEISNCTSIQLGYLPYFLRHALIPAPVAGTETVWLLSGSDRSVHLFRWCREAGRYQGSSSKDRLFPELSRVAGITLHLDIWYSHDMKRRKTASSGESGNIHISTVDLSDPVAPALTASQQINFDFPASSVRLFQRRSRASPSKHLRGDSVDRTETRDSEGDADEPLTLVTTTLEACFVYGASPDRSNGVRLPESDAYDVVTSSLVCDVDFDGENEVVLATYGQMLLIYKERRRGEWEVLLTQALPSPVLALAHEDVLGDGARELVVSTMAGLHVLQVDPAFASDVILRRLHKLKKRN